MLTGHIRDKSGRTPNDMAKKLMLLNRKFLLALIEVGKHATPNGGKLELITMMEMLYNWVVTITPADDKCIVSSKDRL